MAQPATVLRVVVASPADVRSERESVDEVLDELNRSLLRDRGIRLEAVRWETDSYPGFHPLGPQGLIDSILRIEDCDILIGIFWKRFGTSTTTGETGTEHELRRAFDTWRTAGRPHIMVYFNERSYTPKTKDDTDQWGRVLEFRRTFPQEGMLWSYKRPSKFRDLLRTHLTGYLTTAFLTSPKPETLKSPETLTGRPDYFAVQRSVIAAYNSTFVGRDDSESEFEQFTKTRPRGYFIVRGGPGQGKTALACHLIRKYGCAHHLVSRTGGRTDTRLILHSLLAQIRIGAGTSEPPDGMSALIKSYEETLLASASCRTPLVIVIDALDEVPPPIGELPYLVTDALPEGVFFFVTCRPGERFDRLMQSLFAIPHQPHDLGPLSLDEMRGIINTRRPGISDEEVERIAESSQGNPLYLHAVADQLAADPFYNLRDLPPTIEGFYRSATTPLREDSSLLRQVLGLLSVARTSLGVRELAAITGRSQREVDEQGIRPIRQFLLAVEGGYTFYHMMFHEFVMRNVLYEDELRKAHESLVSWLRRPDNRSHPYRWASLGYHIFEAGDHAGLLKEITSEFLAQKVEQSGYAVLEDVELCVRSLLETGEPSVVERCVALLEGLRETVGGDIISDTARSLRGYRAGPDAFRTSIVEPVVPSVPGVEIYVGVLPKAEVSADFFEVVPLDHQLAVAIGDAPSLGLKSSFAARFVANLFHRFVETGARRDLGGTISGINAKLTQHEYFRRISMQCLTIDPLRRIVRMANAGHPYPVHYAAKRGKCDILPLRGNLLHDYIGPAGSPHSWEEYALEVAPGDCLVLVSDGLTEGHLLQGDPYGYRFTALVEAHAHKGPALLGEAILDDWKAYPREEDSADDVSVIVIALSTVVR